MAQEATGSGTAEKKDPAAGATGSITTEMTDEQRDDAASKLVDRFSLWSGAAGLIPVPLVDIAAVGGVQLQMLRRLSEIYGVPFSDNRGKSIIASLAGSVLPASTATTTAMGVSSILKSIPGVGTVIGALTMMHSHKTVRKIGGEEMSIPPQTLHRMWLGFFLTVIGAALVLIHAFLRI